MAAEKHCTKEDLLNLRPRHDSIVCIDSDGCVFDTMELKQKVCFHPQIISHWHLEPIASYVRETAEFVNLYSRGRGRNRFLCLLDTFDLLRDRPEVVASGVPVPEFRQLRQWMASGEVLGNPALEKEVEESGDPESASLLEWSLAVNERVAADAKNVPCFNWVRESLDKMRSHSDLIVVSQTPVEALAREWRESNLDSCVSLIGGQELGTKSEQLAMATEGRYALERILMLGDAPGDMQAAKDNGALFYPINPAREEESWERFYSETYDRFMAGEYAGEYEQRVIDEFEAILPEKPPWCDAGGGPPGSRAPA